MSHLLAPVVADTTDAASGTAAPAVLLLLLVGAAVVLVVLAVRAARRRSLVAGSSLALHRLSELNERSREHVAGESSIRRAFRYRAESKRKFDRFDLDRFLTMSVLEHESYFDQEVERRTRAVDLYAAYRTTIDRDLVGLLATSSHARIEAARFAKIERRLFEKAILRRPVPTARVSASVTYTSPKGQNSYSRQTTWGFEALRDGLRAAQDDRSRQSTAAALRARERSLMTLTLRSDILRRDGYRCRMCGAAGADGVELHVDHILPVSRGGRTIVENLQTLCAPCNLGKGARFVG